jgi:mannosyltransferase
VTASLRRVLARHWLLVGALTMCVALGTSWRLSAPSLWLDEGSTWAISGHSFSDLLRALWHSEADAGALYLVIEHAWLAVWGVSVVALRSLSVVFAVLTIPLFFGLARRVLTRTAALAATTMLAFNAFFLVYARDARMYTLVLALCVAATYCFVRLIESEPSTQWLALYVVAATAAIYTHAFALLVVAAHVVSVAALPDRRARLRSFLVPAGLIAVLSLPLFGYVVFSSARGVDWVPPLKFGQLEQFARDLTGASRFVAPVVGSVVVGCSGVIVIRTLRTAGRTVQLWRTALPLVLFVVPIVGTAAVSLVKPFFVSRYLFIALPGYILSLGLVFERVAQRSRRVLLAVVVALIAIAGPVIIGMWHHAPVSENWRGAEQYVAMAYTPGDSIVVPLCHVHAFGYYAAHDARLTHVRPTWDFPYGPWTVSYRPALRRHTRASALVGTSHTTWVVLRASDPRAGLTVSWRSPRLEVLRRVIRHDPRHTVTRIFPGVVVYRYAPARTL